MSQPQVELRFDAEEPTFTISLDGLTSFEYVITYETEVDGEVVTQALQHQGQAGADGTHTAQHVAGTASGKDILYHQLQAGGLSVSGTTVGGQDFTADYTFTINSLGQLVLKEGQVLGAETASASAQANFLSEPTVTTQLAQAPAAAPPIEAATQAGMGTGPIPLTFVAVVVAALLGTGLVAWLLQHRRSVS